jgi:hypothetical protein
MIVYLNGMCAYVCFVRFIQVGAACTGGEERYHVSR